MFKRRVGSAGLRGRVHRPLVGPHTFFLRFTEQDNVQSPDPVSPANEVFFPNGRRDRRDIPSWSFDWTDVPGASRYELLLFNSANPSLRTTLTLSTSEAIGPYIPQFGNRTYIENAHLNGWMWRVRAQRRGMSSPWSLPRTFKVRRAEPVRQPPPASAPTPTLASPGSGHQMSNADTQGRLQWRFDWQPVPNAQQYQTVVERAASSRPMLSGRITTTSYDINREGQIARSNLSGWTWKVRARTVNGDRGRHDPSALRRSNPPRHPRPDRCGSFSETTAHPSLGTRLSTS